MVERSLVSPYSRFVNYIKVLRDYSIVIFNMKNTVVLQATYNWALRRSNVIVELGKTFGTIPLGLMNVIPGIKPILVSKTFSNLNFMSL
jgi:hypothetical protein